MTCVEDLEMENNWHKDLQDTNSINMCGSQKTVSNSQEELIAHIVKDIQEDSQKPTILRQNSVFYQLVKTGQVSIVRKTLEALETHGLKKELEWAIRAKRTDSWKGEQLHISKLANMKHIFLYIFCAILCVVMSPIFYSVHLAMLRFYGRTRKRISQDIELPLMFATISKNIEMLEIFLEYGCSLTDQDSAGNTVFHYMADLSLDHLNQSIRCYDFVCSNVADMSEINEALMRVKNDASLSGLEATARFGSVHFLQHIIESGFSISKLKVEISQNRIFVTGSNMNFDIRKTNTMNDFIMKTTELSNEESCVLEIDLSDYENGDVFGKQSHLLHLVTAQRVDILPAHDLVALNTSQVFNKWMTEKKTKYMISCIFAHVFAFLITALFTMQMVLNKENMIRYPLVNNYLTNAFNSVLKNGSAFGMAINQTYYDCHEKLTAEEVYHGIFATDENLDNFQISDKYIRWIIIAMIVTHGVFNAITREIFLFKNYNFKSRSLSNGFIPVIQRKLPGSYTENQITLMMYTFYLCALWTFNMYEDAMLDLNVDYEKYSLMEIYLKNETDLTLRLYDTATHYRNITSILFILCLLLRFILFIHTLRLLPSIGFFILTTKKMAQNLAQFIFIFGIVLLSFAAIFMFILKDPECLALNVEGFTSMTESILNVYKLVLGQREAEFVTNDITVLITYFTGTVIIMIMMLNLIIAIMTMTATDLHRTPWKQVICVVELWDEILGIEAMVTILEQPFRAIWSKCTGHWPQLNIFCCKRGSSNNHQKHTFTVIKSTKAHFNPTEV